MVEDLSEADLLVGIHEMDYSYHMVVLVAGRVEIVSPEVAL